MKKLMTGIMAWLMLMALPAFAGGKRMELAVLPLQRHAITLQAADVTVVGEMKATATAHNIVFTWTAFTSSISGLTVQINCGATAGGESSTPIATAISPNAGTYTWTGVTAGATYFCTAASTAPNPAGGTVVSVASNEVSATVPLVQADLPVPGGFQVGSAK